MLTTWETLLAAALTAVGKPAADWEATVSALVDGLGDGELLTLALSDPGLLGVTDYPPDLLPEGEEGENPSALDIVAAVLKQRLLTTLDIVAAATPPPPATGTAQLDQLWWWTGEQLQEASRQQAVAPEPEGADYWAGAVHALHQVLDHLDARRAAGSPTDPAPTLVC